MDRRWRQSSSYMTWCIRCLATAPVSSSCMTDSGLLAVPYTNWISEPALTTELVFEEVLEDGQDDSEYHNDGFEVRRMVTQSLTGMKSQAGYEARG